MESARRREKAARALAQIGPEACLAVPNLVSLLQIPRDCPDVYCNALGAIGPGARDAVPVLESLLSETNLHVRVAAAAALALIVPDSCSNAIHVLKQLERDPSFPAVWVQDGHGVRPTSEKDTSDQYSLLISFSASVALWKLGLEKNPPLTAVLREAKKDRHSSYELSFLRLLGEMGPEAKPALGFLTSLLDVNVGIQTRRAAAIALARIDPGEADRLKLPGILVIP
jgi:HEAT repeat protein